MVKVNNITPPGTLQEQFVVPSSEVRMSHGQLLHSISVGEGTQTILVHGLAASLHDWEVLVPELVSYSFQAIAVDLFGHGDSPKPDQQELYTITTLFRTFEQWIAQLELDTPKMLVGHSLGGHVCLQYALDHPEKISCLVLIDPFYRPGQLSPVLRLLNKRPRVGVKALQTVPVNVIDLVLGWDPVNSAQFSPEARWQIACNCKRASPFILNIPRTIQDLAPQLHKIEIPVLVIWGSKDLTLKPNSFTELVKHLPMAVGEEISDCGHHPHIGKPVLVNRMIIDFLNTHRQDTLGQ